jgi:hypothetical protein
MRFVRLSTVRLILSSHPLCGVLGCGITIFRRGWELLSATVTRAEANSVFVALVFVKWEDVADEVRATKK